MHFENGTPTTDAECTQDGLEKCKDCSDADGYYLDQNSGTCKQKTCVCTESGRTAAVGTDCPNNGDNKCATAALPVANLGTTLATITTLTEKALKGTSVLKVKGQGSLSVGDIIIINLGGETEEKLTIKMFGSIVVLEALKYDHEPGEKISLFQAAVEEESQKSVTGDDTPPSNNNGATAAIIVVVVVVVLLVVGGGVATFFVLRMRRQSASSHTNMKIGPGGRGNKAITIASTDDMNSPTY